MQATVSSQLHIYPPSLSFTSFILCDSEYMECPLHFEQYECKHSAVLSGYNENVNVTPSPP